MAIGKPGISSYDKFSIGHAIRSELKNMGGNLFGLNSAIMKLSNGDDDSRASLDQNIGAREVRKVTSRQIGRTVSSTTGGLGPTSTPARTANLLGNPYMRRYEGPDANGKYNFGLQGAPAIGEYYDLYESEENHLRFLDDTIGRDLFGYTHLENAAIERSGDETNDAIFLQSTYAIFGDLEHPFDYNDIEAFRLGSKRYSPVEPYGIEPLETNLVRKTMDGSIQGFREKFEAVTDEREPYFGPLIDIWDFMGSHYYLNLLNGIAEHGLYVENYEGQQRNRSSIYETGAMPQSDYAYFLNVDTISPDKEIKGLLGKTNRMFYEGKIRSLANRFATLNEHGEGTPDFLNSASDHMYGLSRGRNLRKPNLTQENGYPNPYCRVWTTHYQYSKYKHLIRGKWDTSTNTLNDSDELMRPNKGYDRLKRMGSLDPENGRPIFAPYYVKDRKFPNVDSVKRCMFSIENLAWKDIIPDTTIIKKDPNNTVLGSSFEKQGNISRHNELHNATGYGMTLTKEQIGPNGGRIMWFPPYKLRFDEHSEAQWSDNAFIGRGEKIYTYVNSERRGSLSFRILIDHPSIVNEWARDGKKGKTINKVSPLSKDEMILRYFAGCDALEFDSRKAFDVPYCAITEYKTEKKEITKKVQTDVEKNDRVTYDAVDKEEATITFYSVFYYPNNYSAADFMGQKVSKPDINGTLNNLLPSEQQEFDCKKGLDNLFYEGLRENGEVGYELGHGRNITGMTYNGTYYTEAKSKHYNKNNKWYYLCDSRVANEDLTGSPKNEKPYKDEDDYGLNSSFYGNFWGDIDSVPEGKLKDYLNEGNTGLTDSPLLKEAKGYISIVADNKYFIPAINFYENLEKVVKRFDAETNGTYTYEIEVQGYASQTGYSSNAATRQERSDMAYNDIASKKVIETKKGAKSNEILAENRAAVIEGWIRSLGNTFSFTEGEKSYLLISHNGNGHIDGTNKGGESSFPQKASRVAVVKFSIIPSKTIITENHHYSETPIYEEVKVPETSTTKENKEKYDTRKAEDYENQTYDNEYAYFKQINENDDMVKRYISDKVDYFDPAFHSITPEGFNARLTFLQQCVRQGPTISASDLGRGGSYGAGNLSFGRAPFCVLRIGDFYNTKICINNVDIKYDSDGMLWDMNPEGIGLQPMYADVTITFTFLGGSDLSGPISRLQNAVSFNYYANTSVYDRRSDYSDVFTTKEDDTVKTWSPVILDKNKDANVTEYRDFWTRKGPKNNES